MQPAMASERAGNDPRCGLPDSGPDATVGAATPYKAGPDGTPMGLFEGIEKIYQQTPAWEDIAWIREHADEIPPPPSFEAVSAAWVRAAKSGIFHLNAHTGDQVKRGQTLVELS